MTQKIKPINFLKWIDENQDKLQPPVCNIAVYEDGEMIIMVVGGPNNRKDYHYNETPEFFYQIKGDMLLKIIDDGEFVDIVIKEGEIYLLPANIPHSPQRYEDTVGLVIEQIRPKGVEDALQWHCESCAHMIYKESFIMKNIVTELPRVFEHFYTNKDHRTCQKCSAVMERP